MAIEKPLYLSSKCLTTMSASKRTKPTSASDRITRLDFCATHFNGAQLPSDMFYVGLANKIYPIIRKIFSTKSGSSRETNKRMAVTLACYVEDLVAGSGIWAAFTSLYKKKYGDTLPFYNIREQGSIFPYDDEKPSFHAVLFLLWYVANDAEPDIVINPNNPGLRMLAMALTPDLEKAYDEAPETPARPMLMSEEELGIPLFYQIRNLCSWLSDRCYLTRIIDRKKTTDEFKDFIRHIFESVDNMDKGAETYAIESFVPMNALIGPLAIPAYEWLAEIVDLYHEPEEEKYLPILAALKSRPYSYYRYETVGDNELVMEDVSGKRFTLSAETFPGERFPAEAVPGQSALLSLVRIGGVWMMNGIGLPALPPEVYEDYRKAHSKKTLEQKETYKYNLKAFGKQRIGVCASYEEYAKMLFGDNPPEFKGDPKMLADIRDAGNLIYFLNTDGTMSILPGWAGCVKIKDNPYYDAEDAAQDGISLIFDQSLSSPEMREYIINKKLIPDAALNSVISAEAGRKLFQKNIRFFNDYCNRDSMTFLMTI